MFDERQLIAIESLVAGCTKRETAKRAGVSVQTLWSWEQSDDFALEVEHRKTVTAMEVAMQARPLFAMAVATLAKGLQEDARLALSFLKETGALTTVGRENGMSTESSPDHSITVVINTHGAVTTRTVEAIVDSPDLDDPAGEAIVLE